MLQLKNKQREEGAYLLIWTLSTGEEKVSEPLDRGEALRQFDNCSLIRAACHPYNGARLRVVAEADRAGGTR